MAAANESDFKAKALIDAIAAELAQVDCPSTGRLFLNR